MKLIRKPLADSADKTGPRVVFTYDDITLATGNNFIDSAAVTERDEVAAYKSVVVTNDPDPNDGMRIRHTATIIGKNDKPMVEYFGIWPDEEGKYKLPEGVVEREMEQSEMYVLVKLKISHRHGADLQEVVNECDYDFTSDTQGATIYGTELMEVYDRHPDNK